MLTNKELAVQLYSAFLQAASTVTASPNVKGNIAVKLPTNDEMVAAVKELAEKLATIDN
jgi:hypothetical protein